MCGGEVLSYDVISHLLNVTTVSNCYGPTETTVCSLFHKIDKNERSPNSRIPIGRPIPNTKAFILDSFLNPVPVNVPGELYIGGHGLARGYLNKPEQTTESFIMNPFGDPGERLYRTGDLARYRSDGCIEFVGRRDQQVKVRGLRIELGEIESRLSQHPQIVNNAVIAVGDNQRDKQLVAYYVSHANAAISDSRLRQHLSASLPSHMVPSRFVLVESMPRTPSGKVDREKLAAVDTRRRQTDQEYVAPRSHDQSVLAAIWEDVLGVDKVGINDDYFALGGHSLLAVQLMSRVNEAFHLEIPLKTLFDAPTVALLAERIGSIRYGKVSSATWQKQEVTPLVPIKTSGNGAPIYCIHHIGGHIFSYKHLAVLLSPRFRVYGIQSRALRDPTTEHVSLERMASDYADVIRSQQPDGPYNLIGYSSGGLAAIAIAHKLERMGASVGFVGLIDTRFPGNDQQAIDRDSLHHLLQSLRFSFADTIEILGDTMDLSLNQMDSLYEQLLPLSNDERIDYVCHWLDNLDLPHEGLSHLLKQQLTLYQHHYSMLKSFRPSMIHSPLLVLWAKEEIPGMQHQPQVDWTNHTSGGVFAETTEGNHFTIMRPPAVEILARRLIAQTETFQHIAPVFEKKP
jgi:thioesterase domain-containing protein/acyl carrier protein